MKKIREIIELNAFGVCSSIGEKLGIASSKIRMWFIYISFLTMGSPIVIYMIMAFWMNMKKASDARTDGRTRCAVQFSW